MTPTQPHSLLENICTYPSLGLFPWRSRTSWPLGGAAIRSTLRARIMSAEDIGECRYSRGQVYWHHPTCPVEVLRRLEVRLVRGRLLVLVWEGVAVVARPGLAAAGLGPH